MGYGGYVSVQKSKILSLLQFFYAQGNFILNLVPIRTLWHYGQIAHFIILRRKLKTLHNPKSGFYPPAKDMVRDKPLDVTHQVSRH